MSKETRNVGLAFLLSVLLVSAASTLSYFFVLVPAQAQTLICKL